MSEKIVTLGIDLSKHYFQCHAVDKAGNCLFMKTLTKKKLLEYVSNLSKCTIVTEACGGAHYFARKFRELGHEAKMIAPVYVKPFVKSNKNDAADAEAIVEADSRPNMRYVGIKEVWQQDLQCIHRVRERLIKGKTALTNEIRGFLLEYGISFAKGDSALVKALREVLSNENESVTPMTKLLMQDLFSEFIELQGRISTYDEKLKKIARKDDSFKRLNPIRGLGLISITALIIALADPKVFKNGRHFSAWLGLVPKHSGTGGKNRNLGISKRGDRYFRSLLIHGARAVVWAVRKKVASQKPLDPLEKWIYGLYQKKGTNKTAVALANKNARMAWAIMAHGKQYDVGLATTYQNNVAA